MTANQVIVLLDVHRGFKRDIHPGTIERDLQTLMRDAVIDTGSGPHFEFELTEKGDKLVKRLLEQADLR